MFRWLKKFLRIITILLPSFVGVVFFTNNSFATSVSCDLSSFSSFISSSSDRSDISNFCVLSSLDSTKDWFYSVDYSFISSVDYFDSSSTPSIYAIVSSSSPIYRFPNPGDLIYVPASPDFSSSSGSYVRLISDSPSFRIQLFRKFTPVNNTSSLWDFSPFLTINSFTVSDEFPSGGSSVEPEEPDCPELPENPYDNKLDEIKYAIYAIGGVMLVIYFFYAIYKMIIGGTK